MSTMFSSPVSISASSGNWRLAAAIADLGSVDARHAWREHPLDRARQVVIEAGLGCSIVGAKAQHNPDLVGRHRIESVQQPEDDDGEGDHRNPGAGVEVARQHAAESILAAAQQRLEIGRLRAAAARARPTAIAAVAAAPRAAAARTGAPWATA